MYKYQYDTFLRQNDYVSFENPEVATIEDSELEIRSCWTGSWHDGTCRAGIGITYVVLYVLVPGRFYGSYA